MRSLQTRVESVMDVFTEPASERDAMDIRKLRWSHGLTQQEMADGLNISLLEMEYIESGYCRVPEDTRAAILAFLKSAVPVA
ncbi:DNA-binding XRE family transcriptional regulator [Rhodoblastus acidophilus]|uniref:helix-turn-helix transcriptional regulator n=1 Tax=Rhodoblastus acidophilus TaxID=1074 RepID=UPI0022248C39|nr:helix-turn-helix transcriptional regulator [Rhodoblastus acidophilus]MCW2283685.1 DNA-binding XRE family transcriptional regulator [Rhodoblastus acidophilus]MCW2332966.1 DNA-binding XRE family transcriptional regulator [Rhodoblastus acidophilus]